MAAAWAQHTEMTSPAQMGGTRAVVILGSWRVIGIPLENHFPFFLITDFASCFLSATLLLKM